MTTHKSEKLYLRHTLSILAILAAILVCYVFSLNSLFLFDDFPNLDALVHLHGESIASPGFWEFVLGGNSGPTGRPVSLFTFALQANSWPANPAAFKLVNLFIHCLNSLLVYAICAQICKALKISAALAWKIIFSTTLLWAIHPIHTTLVLYAVQRMALLSNFFILLGIALHLHIRLGKCADKSNKQLLLLTASLAFTGLLALFSKENAPSLIFFLLILEYTVLKHCPVNPRFIQWRYVFLCLPALLTFILPLFFLSQLQADFDASYGYSIITRLLTESRILWQYLAIIFIPSGSGVGLFHDIEISQSFFSPISTLISVLAWLSLFAIAILRQGKHKILLLAVLWYFAGHLIESTILPLELFFNHRNYLAFLGFIFAAFYTLFSLPNRFLSSPIKLAFPALYTFILLFQTVSISNLWREPLNLSESWYMADMDTTRNAEFYAITLANRDFEGMLQAAQIYEQAFSENPGNFRLLLNRMNLSCNSSFIIRPDDEFITQSLERIGKENRDLLSPLQQLVSLTTSNTCNIYSPELLSRIISQVMIDAPDQLLGLYEFELANLAFYTGRFDDGISLLQLAYLHSSDPGVLFSLSLRYINAGQYQDALLTIDQTIARLGLFNNIRTGSREYKLGLLYQMRTDVLGFITDNENLNQ